MATTTTSVAETCAVAKRASRTLATLGSGVKDAALEAIATALAERAPEILEANARDLEAGRENGLAAALLDRLALNELLQGWICHSVPSSAVIFACKSTIMRSIPLAASNRPASRASS